MKRSSYKKWILNPLNASIIAFALGLLSICCSIYIGNRFFNSSLESLEKQYHKFYLREARLLVQAARSEPLDNDREILKRVQQIWETLENKHADEYICIVDKDARLILHSSRPETIGKYAGKNPLTGKIAPSETCLNDLVGSGRDYVGGYISSGGQDQLAAFAAVPEKGWVIGVHRSKKDFLQDVEAGIAYSKTGFYLISGLLMPISWLLIFLTFHIAHKNHLKAEQRLIESQTRFRLAMEATQDGLYDWNLATNEIYYSPGWKRMLGYREDELPDEFSVWEALTAPEDAERSWEMQKELISKKRDRFEIELRMRHKNGHWVEILSRASAVFDESGTAVRIVGTHVDITQHNRAKAEIEASRTMFETVFNSQLDAILILDSKTPPNVLESNEAASKIFGFTPEEITQSRADDFHIDETHQRVFQKQLYSAIETEGSLKNFNFAMKRKDGSVFPSEHTILEMKNNAGQRMGWISIVRDLSEVQEAKKALFESEDKFRMLFDKSPLSYQSLDENGNFLEVNATWTNMLGYKKEEVMGSNFADFIDPAWREHFKNNFSRFKAIGEVLGVEFEMVKKDGSRILVAFHGKIGKNADGSFKQTHCIFHDITRQRQLEKEREIMVRRMAQIQKMESIGNLAGGIAHDFNNILFPIIGLSEMLMDDFSQGTSEHENASEIHMAGKRGSDLVKQILSFSRQHEHKFIPIRIQKILKEVLKLSRSTIPTDIEIRENIKADSGPVMADPSQIHQVAMNLITNALHAVEKKDNGIIDIRLREESLEAGDLADRSLLAGRYVRLSVSDNGIGMDDSVLEKVFEPYFTTKKKGKGTGLGLAVVYGIIREHKGDIKIFSEKGKGTECNIYLPLMGKFVEAPPGDAEQVIETGSERILLVDDEKSVAKLEGQMISRLGYQVTEQTRSKEALSLFKADPNKFDLVITDMTMPHMTGDQLAKEILLIKPDIPIIICTGFSERINKEQAELIGVKGFLMKPVVRSKMASMIRRVLNESKKGIDHGQNFDH